jgi:cullin 3
MVILLLFNDRTEISYKEIRDATGIPIPDLKRNLMALSVAKYKILDKEPNSKKVEDNDVFKYNAKFKSKLFRVKVMTVVQKESESERTETRQKVDEDRKHQYPLLLRLLFLY